MDRKDVGYPNQRLKYQRNRHGWSQHYVAEQIGTNPFTVSRWERGKSHPDRYFCEKLCELFKTTAEDLGIVPNVDENREPVASAICDPAIPLLPVAVNTLPGRDGILRLLKEELCIGEKRLVALKGLPGVGKTALATWLAHDQDIIKSFSGGILWVGLGSSADPSGLLARWSRLLNVSTVEATKFTNVRDSALALRDAIGGRKMLIVIDDAWEIEHALTFKVGGPHCAYLLTTRCPLVAFQFASDTVFSVEELAEEDGIEVLQQIAPQVVEREPAVVRELVRSVGGLPLALTIMGKYLQLHSHAGQPRRLHAALNLLQDVKARLELSQPYAPLERPPALPADSAVSLQTIIAISDQRLNQDAREALHALALFPPKPNSFPEEAALAVCGKTVDVLDMLSDVGMLEVCGIGCYTLHQTIADYARLELVHQYGQDSRELFEKIGNWKEEQVSNWLAILAAGKREQ